MIRAVIFDLDDTLISERKYIESGYLHISKLLSKRVNKSAIKLYQLLITLFEENPKYVFNRLFKMLEINYTQNDILELVEQYRNHLPTIKLFDDVLPCLKELKKKKIKLGIITDGFANAQRQKLKAIDVKEYFDEIIVTDELGRDFWKPHPKAFEIMKNKLDVKFNEMIYVGDNPKKDFYISNKYPILTIRIYREGIYCNQEYLNGVMENHSIRSLDDLNYIVQKENA
ncbi:HAD-IA family hydrolase [Schinkia azotoformans]|uniref:HAD-IA family hydrolase n=1 Tax=Schinkia azotoformans TaxID=1454 RepID=UPI002E229E6C|nr:HAD-IA family hydrolase [Schinkia azotoformans]MED4375447.1 HAD-IA family hydrolase [Schinkia azotoformans]